MVKREVWRAANPSESDRGSCGAELSRLMHSSRSTNTFLEPKAKPDEDADVDETTDDNDEEDADEDKKMTSNL